MSESVRNYIVAIFGFDHVMRSVGGGAWSNASPCAEWSARDVAGHAMTVVANVASAAQGGPRLDPFTNPGELATDDPYGAWYEIRDGLLVALDRPDVLDVLVDSSLGRISMDEYIKQMTCDVLVHTWDLARATGGDDRLDQRLVPIVHATLARRGEEALRAPARFVHELDVDDAASPQAQLLAFAGRNP
jgi:uncharacterized protein (TIGR03086 family)